ncbi:DUF397 domain-containing protein [Streptomyces antimycoticus]|uniref:DUF397 domain-containing protein n=1 Tax=Streptomyces antimycoticus TaxID=68175 RepID=UPI0036E7A3BE
MRRRRETAPRPERGRLRLAQSYSDSSGGDCVEVATTPTTVHIRDSKNPDGPRLRTAATAWADFLAFATR